MRKKIHSVFLLLSICLFSISRADDFDDFEQAVARVATNYNRAVDSRGTRFEKSYKQHVSAMCELAKKVQDSIDRLKLGADLDMVWITEEIRQIYNENNKDFKAGENRLKRMVGRSRDPATLFKIIAEDIKTLKTMRFTTDNGGAVKDSLMVKRRLLAYNRMLRFFMKYQSSYRRRKDDDSFRKLFDRRMTALENLAGSLDSDLRSKNPNAGIQVKLAEETSIMLKNFEELYKSQLKKKTYTVRRAGENTTVSALSSEMHFALQNIRKFLIELDNAGVETDPAGKETAESAVQKESASMENRYEKMSPEELNAELSRRRREIYRSNTSMDGFDRDVLAEYLASLSREQRKQYNKYLREYRDEGLKNNQAIRSAVLRLHTGLISGKNTMTAREMTEALLRLDKQKKKELKELDVLD